MNFVAIIVFTFLTKCDKAAADAGGHDLFTSLVQLKEMWSNDREFVKTLRAILPILENLTDASKR